MIGSFVFGLTALLAMQEAAPAGASAILSALDARDSSAVQALLSGDAVIMDEHSGNPEPSTPAAFLDFLRGCERAGLAWDTDQENRERIALTISWICPSRGTTDTYVWTANGKVEFVQFGQIAPTSQSEAE